MGSDYQRVAMRLLPLLLPILFLVACQDQTPQSAPKAPPSLAVKTLTAHKKTVPIWATYTGTARASSEQTVRARVSGKLLKRYFQDGQRVKKGQKLFLIEPDRYKAALKAAQAQKRKDEAALKLAQANVARYRPLVAEGLAPRATLEEYEAQVAQFKAALLGDEAKIADAKLNLSYTVVRAPVSGRAGKRLVDVGNLVGFGEATPLVTILQTDPIYVEFAPSEKEASKIAKYGGRAPKRAVVRLLRQDPMLKTLELNATVDFADNRIDPATSTLTMRAVAPNPDEALLPGTFVYVDLFVTDRYPFFTVPKEALQEDQQGMFVYVVQKGKAVRKSVKIAFETRRFFAVQKGLKEGDRVIVSNLIKVRDGLPVKAQEE